MAPKSMSQLSSSGAQPPFFSIKRKKDEQFLPGLQKLSGATSGSPGGRQTRSKTDALLRVDESGVGISKFSVEMLKGFEELPPTDPQYQGIQGFSFGDFSPLGGEVSKDTTSNMTIGAKEAPSRDIGNVEVLKKEIELEGKVASDPKGKAKEQTAAVESVRSHFCSRLACRSAGSPCAAD
jgi:hypothetical protein